MIFTLNMNLFHLRNSFSFTPCSSVETIEYLFQRTTTGLGTNFWKMFFKLLIMFLVNSTKACMAYIGQKTRGDPGKNMSSVSLACGKTRLNGMVHLSRPQKPGPRLIPGVAQ